MAIKNRLGQEVTGWEALVVTAEHQRDLYGEEIVAIARLFGITAWEYKNLSGPQVLHLADCIKEAIKELPQE